MKKRICAIVLAVAMVLSLMVFPVSADTTTGTYGYMTYEIADGEVTITDCYTSASGELVIPSTIEGYPVTTIGSYAFAGSGLLRITIPDSVTSIGYSAFYNCTSLLNATIGDGLTEIASFMFEGCTRLTSVVIGDGTTTIGTYAFYGCTSLTSVTMGNSLTKIDNWAFQDCTGLTSITLPDSVTSIGDFAFCGCTSLISITIPDSVTSISNSAFNGCTSLTSITFEGDAPTFGMEYSSSYSTFSSVTATAYYPAGNSTWTEDVMQDYGGSITWVAYGSSSDPATEVVASGTCGDNLTWVLDSNGTLTISGTGDMTDWSFTSDVPWYDYSNNIVAVVIKSGVTSIGEGAFLNCTNLTSITIPNSVTSIGDGAFYSCTSLTSVTIPDSVTSIGWGAFQGCTSLSSITIPNSVTYIEESAFYGCTSLTGITIPNSVTYIGAGTFYECTSLTSVTIGNSVTSILRFTFEGCTSLTSITIPNSVTSIDVEAFYECTSLTSITIPNSVTSIDGSAFASCTSLTSITFEGNAPDFGSIDVGNDVFYGVTATAYYPAGNSTWTEDVMQDYGGNITWVAYDPNTVFTDVNTSNYFYDAVLWAVDNGITSGTSATTFSPFQTAERCQVVTFLWRAAGCPNPTNTENPFTDVSESDYFYTAVLWAVEKGITSGTTATTFSPYAKCERCQVVTFLYRYFGEPTVTTGSNSFTDVNASNYFYNAVQWAVQNGITSGTTATTFGPYVTCERCMVVTFLYRALA